MAENKFAIEFMLSFIFRLGACCFLVTVGCNSTEIPVYQARTEVAELPEKHRTEISDYLLKYYGTPLAPLLRVTKVENEEHPYRDLVSSAELIHGQQVYAAQCAGCHGITGDGNGPAAEYLDPKPRDYRKGVFKFTSTPRGRKPRHEDLVRIIHYGAKGTSMPAFRWMPEEDLLPLIAYVKSLSSRGELEIKLIRESEDELEETDSYDADVVGEYADEIAASWNEASQQIVLPTTTKVPYNEQTVELGARAFVKESCYKCHGIDGRGNPQNNVGKDDWGNVAFAANLSTGMLHGGRRPLDIYRRIHSGINGTPMPGFGATLDSQGRPETVWHLTHFITSIVQGRELPKELLAELAKEAEDAIKARSQSTNVQPEETKPAVETPEKNETEKENNENAEAEVKTETPAKAEASDATKTDSESKTSKETENANE
jgi:mono/diheme cytochrome c family protein